MNLANKLEKFRNCRTCLLQKQSLNSLDRLPIENVSLREMLQFILDGTETPEENVELNNICGECEQNLIISYNFKIMCLQTRNRVTDLLNEIKNEENLQSHQEAENESSSIQIRVLIENQDISELFIENIGDDHHLSSTELIEGKDDKGKSLVKTLKKNKVKRKQQKQNFCQDCNLQFEDSSILSAHRCKVHNQDKHLCPYCGKLIANLAMEKHIASAHTNSKNHLCTECGKTFTLSENLKKHWRIHNLDKRYSCDYCPEKFIHWNSKRSHMRTFHTGEKKYECKICFQRFAQSSNMFRHVRLHTGQLPHSCTFTEICTKKFATSSELKHHIVVHTKEKNEVCNVCNKAFGTKKALRIHHRTHTGEKNYICPDPACSKAFSQAHVLRTHMKVHPDCIIPPKGAVLSKKILEKPVIVPSLLRESVDNV